MFPSPEPAVQPPDELNEPQAQAASHVDGPLLVFAGAGSGKTRVITYRIANLVAVHHVPPYRVLAVTFTNKAAGEMRRRLERLLGPDITRDLWIGTFHAVCARLLRRMHDAAELDRNFVIYDDSDQRAVMNRVIKELELDDRRYPARQLLSRIHKEKQEGRRAADFVPEGYFDDVIARAFAAYERHLKAANAVDFDDLITAVMRIAEDHESLVGRELRQRFHYLLVDEFQDVNQVQYRLLRALVDDHKNLCAVGDDDQSIYRWRGADVRIVRGFRRDFPDATIVKLEQNYRSTGNIVKSALGVIRPAREREPKELWTARRAGEPVMVVAAENEHDEAAWVVERVQELAARGKSLSEMAIFYRVHAQSRVLEEVLRAAQLPYQIIGGTRFFERAEVKDLLSYLRVIDNPRSDVDLERIINVPPRKIGQGTIDKLLATATALGMSLADAIDPLVEQGSIATQAKRSLLGFKDLLHAWMREARTAPPSMLAERVLEESGYSRMLDGDDSAESDARKQNLSELVGSIMEYETEAAAQGEVASLAGYLERVTLSSDIDALQDAPRIAMMTVHAAKGLEFEAVFVTGLEDELFPFQSPDPKRNEDIEEERRLMYVAVTRARERLYLTHAGRRMIFGQSRYGVPSRFLRDLPPAALSAMATPSATAALAWRRGSRETEMSSRPRGSWTHPFSDTPRNPLPAPSARRAEPPVARAPGERYVEREHGADAAEEGRLSAGSRVVHEKFGIGVVVSVDSGVDPIVTVSFSGRGTKRIKAGFLRTTR
jgi:DNA helicase-2/ATP-dependent DNA helicase PcrA